MSISYIYRHDYIIIQIISFNQKLYDMSAGFQFLCRSFAQIKNSPPTKHFGER